MLIERSSPCQLQLFDRVLRDLETIVEIESDTFFSHDALPLKGSRAKTCTGKLRVGFVGKEDASWTSGMPVAAVQACAEVTRKEELFYP